MRRWSVDMDAILQKRLIGGVGTAAILGAIGAGLVLGLDVDMQAIVDRPLQLITLHTPPPPPPEKPRPKIEQPKRAPAKDAPAPPALKAKATPVVAPPPIVRLPPPLPLVVTPKPGVGAQASNGASDRPGPGEGAGGRGNGRGGGYGDGEGGDTPPRQTGGDFSRSDLPEALRSSGWQGGVTVSFTVETNGRVTGCRVTIRSGRPELDALICPLVERRYRYRPARDETDRAVRATIVDERIRWVMSRDPIDRDDD